MLAKGFRRIQRFISESHVKHDKIFHYIRDCFQNFRIEIDKLRKKNKQAIYCDLKYRYCNLIFYTQMDLILQSVYSKPKQSVGLLIK